MVLFVAINTWKRRTSAIKKGMFLSNIPAIVSFALFLVAVPVSAQVSLTQDQYVFVHTLTTISGTADQPTFIDFPTYSYGSTSGVLTSKEPIPLTSDTKLIIGGGTSVSGGVGSGAATGLKLYDSLSVENVFTVISESMADYYIDGRWITLQKGIQWTETYETTSYKGFTGQLIIKNTATYYGVQDKNLISAEITTPSVTPVPTPSAIVCGDVDGNGKADIIDALKIARYYVGLTPTSFDPSHADVNASGTVDIVDALKIAQYYVGLPGTLVCQ
jgi:hypothetical protein